MEVKEILKKHGFVFKKNLGQNFLTEGSLLRAIVRDAGVNPTDIVVEIGTGAGTLTAVLANTAAEVYTFDVDEALKPVLKETLAGLNNVTVNFKDILKMSDEEVREIVGDRPFKVVANIPYYVTTPLIMRFLESALPVESLTLMVQKEVAERLVAVPDTEQYGAITLAVELRGNAAVTRIVDRRLFHPVPKVDSAVVRIDIDRNKLVVKDAELLARLVRAGFQMRRKTLANNVEAVIGVPKETVKGILTELGYNPSIRGEAMSLSDYVRVADALSDLK